MITSDLEACHMETEEEQKNQQTLVFTLLKNIGVVAMKLKLYHKTIKHIDKALKCQRSVMTQNDRVKCFYLIGKANRLIGELKMSQFYLEK